MNTEDRVFTIMDVLAADQIPVYRKRGNEYYFLCPCCKKPMTDEKCSANPARGDMYHGVTTGAWSCFRCGSGGGPVSLHMAYTGIGSPKEAAKDLHRKLGDDSQIVYTSPVKEERPVKEGVKSDIKKQDKVYKAMAGIQKLSKTHTENLLKRGLTEKDIKDGMFFDIPRDGYAFCRRLINDAGLSPEDLEGIAGLYNGWNGEKTSFGVKSGGFFCPAWTYDRLIRAGQVSQPERSKADPDAPKYIWYSSSEKDGGVSSGAQCSVNKGSEPGIVIITEGTLKSYVTWCLLKRRVTVISVPGVRCLGYLPAELNNPEVVGKDDVVMAAFDMDKKHMTVNAMHDAYEKRDKKYKDYNYTDYSLHIRDKADDISAREKKLLKLIRSTGHYAAPISWDVSASDKELWNGNIKGIDDLLAYLDDAGREKFYDFLKKKAETIKEL